MLSLTNIVAVARALRVTHGVTVNEAERLTGKHLGFVYAELEEMTHPSRIATFIMTREQMGVS
jgi:hypothetical protein